MNSDPYSFITPLEEKPEIITGLTWIGPYHCPAHIFSDSESTIREQFETALKSKQEQLIEDGRRFKSEGGDIHIKEVTNFWGKTFVICTSLSLITLLSPIEAKIGDYVHTEAIPVSSDVEMTVVNGMQFKKDTAHGYSAWKRIG